MPELHEFWDPTEWELAIHGLLQDRDGVFDILKVPARHKGDLGLDYYCLAKQVVYQCYAVQEPCEVKVRAEKQQAKITTDLKKFVKNATKLKKLFGDVKVRNWVLVVPIHDSVEVNGHLTKKTDDIKKLKLTYVTNDFQVLIHDLETFDRQSREQRLLQRKQIQIPSKAPTMQEVEAWRSGYSGLSKNLMEKLSKRVGNQDPALLEQSVQQAVGWFLERDNILETLRTDAPDLYETLFSIISRHTARLQFYGPPSEGTANAILRTELEKFTAELIMEIPNLSKASAEQIALGTIAEWLLRCPLDFPPYSHVS